MNSPNLPLQLVQRFSLWQRLQLATIPWLLAKIVAALYRSCSLEVRGLEHYQTALEPYGRCHMAIWHEVTALASCHNSGRDYVGMTSLSFDGEFVTRVLKHWRIYAARGSSSRGGGEALAVLVKAATTATITGMTIDGPRGPRREAKPGIAVLAARTQLPILPGAYAIEKAWRLNSWDRFIIPKPFSRIICAYARPIPPPVNETPKLIEEARFTVDQRLNEMHNQIENELGLL